MIKTFPIEFIRIALLQTLYEQHIKNNYYFGGNDQISLLSFYEQLKTQDDVDRFTEILEDLVEQQNRTDLIGNGIITSPENPTITNLYTATIIPMTYTTSIRTKLKNRDEMIETINNLIEELKGSKCDIAQLECTDENGKKFYQPFKVGTIGHNDNQPAINNGDYIGNFTSRTPTLSEFTTRISQYTSLGIANNLKIGDYVYFSYLNKELKVAISLVGEVLIDSITYEEVNYDRVGNDTVSVNTQIRFKSAYPIENGILPNIGDFVLRFFVEDSNRFETFDVTVTPDETSLDSEGYLVGTGLVEFTIVESEWDFTTINTGFDEVITNPTSNEWKIVEDSKDYPYVVFPPEHSNFEKYKLSMSFDAIRCDEPRTLNGEEYCEISFGGSATLTNANIRLGNDLVKVSIVRLKIVADPTITFDNSTLYHLEPLEMPSGSNANTVISQLASNNFKQNTHTDGIALSIQYTFIADYENDLLKQWFNYGRYGTFGDSVSPNMIYQIREWWSYWGNVERSVFLGKIVESIDIENTESDTMTISVNFQIQGENN